MKTQRYPHFYHPSTSPVHAHEPTASSSTLLRSSTLLKLNGQLIVDQFTVVIDRSNPEQYKAFFHSPNDENHLNLILDIPLVNWFIHSNQTIIMSMPCAQNNFTVRAPRVFVDSTKVQHRKVSLIAKHIILNNTFFNQSGLLSTLDLTIHQHARVHLSKCNVVVEKNLHLENRSHLKIHGCPLLKAHHCTQSRHSTISATLSGIKFDLYDQYGGLKSVDGKHSIKTWNHMSKATIKNPGLLKDSFLKIDQLNSSGTLKLSHLRTYIKNAELIGRSVWAFDEVELNIAGDWYENAQSSLSITGPHSVVHAQSAIFRGTWHAQGFVHVDEILLGEGTYQLHPYTHLQIHSIKGSNSSTILESTQAVICDQKGSPTSTSDIQYHCTYTDARLKSPEFIQMSASLSRLTIQTPTLRKLNLDKTFVHYTNSLSIDYPTQVNGILSSSDPGETKIILSGSTSVDLSIVAPKADICIHGDAYGQQFACHSKSLTQSGNLDYTVVSIKSSNITQRDGSHKAEEFYYKGNLIRDQIAMSGYQLFHHTGGNFTEKNCISRNGKHEVIEAKHFISHHSENNAQNRKITAEKIVFRSSENTHKNLILASTGETTLIHCNVTSTHTETKSKKLRILNSSLEGDNIAMDTTQYSVFVWCSFKGKHIKISSQQLHLSFCSTYRFKNMLSDARFSLSAFNMHCGDSLHMHHTLGMNLGNLSWTNVNSNSGMIHLGFYSVSLSQFFQSVYLYEWVQAGYHAAWSYQGMNVFSLAGQTLLNWSVQLFNDPVVNTIFQSFQYGTMSWNAYRLLYRDFQTYRHMCGEKNPLRLRDISALLARSSEVFNSHRMLVYTASDAYQNIPLQTYLENRYQDIHDFYEYWFTASLHKKDEQSSKDKSEKNEPSILDIIYLWLKEGTIAVQKRLSETYQGMDNNRSKPKETSLIELIQPHIPTGSPSPLSRNKTAYDPNTLKSPPAKNNQSVGEHLARKVTQTVFFQLLSNIIAGTGSISRINIGSTNSSSQLSGSIYNTNFFTDQYGFNASVFFSKRSYRCVNHGMSVVFFDSNTCVVYDGQNASVHAIEYSIDASTIENLNDLLAQKNSAQNIQTLRNRVRTQGSVTLNEQGSSELYLTADHVTVNLENGQKNHLCIVANQSILLFGHNAHFYNGSYITRYGQFTQTGSSEFNRNFLVLASNLCVNNCTTSGEQVSYIHTGKNALNIKNLTVNILTSTTLGFRECIMLLFAGELRSFNDYLLAFSALMGMKTKPWKLTHQKDTYIHQRNATHCSLISRGTLKLEACHLSGGNIYLDGRKGITTELNRSTIQQCHIGSNDYHTVLRSREGAITNVATHYYGSVFAQAHGDVKNLPYIYTTTSKRRYFKVLKLRYITEHSSQQVSMPTHFHARNGAVVLQSDSGNIYFLDPSGYVAYMNLSAPNGNIIKEQVRLQSSQKQTQYGLLGINFLTLSVDIGVRNTDTDSITPSQNGLSIGTLKERAQHSLNIGANIHCNELIQKCDQVTNIPVYYRIDQTRTQATLAVGFAGIQGVSISQSQWINESGMIYGHSFNFSINDHGFSIDVFTQHDQNRNGWHLTASEDTSLQSMSAQIVLSACLNMANASFQAHQLAQCILQNKNFIAQLFQSGSAEQSLKLLLSHPQGHSLIIAFAQLSHKTEYVNTLKTFVSVIAAFQKITEIVQLQEIHQRYERKEQPDLDDENLEETLSDLTIESPNSNIDESCSSSQNTSPNQDTSFFPGAHDSKSGTEETTVPDQDTPDSVDHFAEGMIVLNQQDTDKHDTISPLVNDFISTYETIFGELLPDSWGLYLNLKKFGITASLSNSMAQGKSFSEALSDVASAEIQTQLFNHALVNLGKGSTLIASSYYLSNTTFSQITSYIGGSLMTRSNLILLGVSLTNHGIEYIFDIQTPIGNFERATVAVIENGFVFIGSTISKQNANLYEVGHILKQTILWQNKNLSNILSQMNHTIEWQNANLKNNLSMMGFTSKPSLQNWLAFNQNLFSASLSALKNHSPHRFFHRNPNNSQGQPDPTLFMFSP